MQQTTTQVTTTSTNLPVETVQTERGTKLEDLPLPDPLRRKVSKEVLPEGTPAPLGPPPSGANPITLTELFPVLRCLIT